MIDKIVPPGEPPAAAQPATERPCEHQWVMQMLMVPTGTGSITKPGSIRCCLCGSFKLQNQVGIIQPPAAQPATEDWQPIETAPTCGKWIVIPGPKLARFVVAEPCYWITSHYEQIAPTHWMPLPDPPSLQPPAALVSPTRILKRDNFLRLAHKVADLALGNSAGIVDPDHDPFTCETCARIADLIIDFVTPDPDPSSAVVSPREEPGKHFIPMPGKPPCQTCGQPEGVILRVSATGFSVTSGFEHRAECPALRCQHGVRWQEDCAECHENAGPEEGEE